MVFTVPEDEDGLAFCLTLLTQQPCRRRLRGITPCFYKKCLGERLGTEGLGIISIFIETVLFGTLDVLATVGFGFILLSNPGALERTEITGFAFLGS